MKSESCLKEHKETHVQREMGRETVGCEAASTTTALVQKVQEESGTRRRVVSCDLASQVRAFRHCPLSNRKGGDWKMN